jgi:hypothetical protein
MGCSAVGGSVIAWLITRIESTVGGAEQERESSFLVFDVTTWNTSAPIHGTSERAAVGGDVGWARDCDNAVSWPESPCGG